MLAYGSLVGAVSVSGISARGIHSHPLLRRSGYTKDQEIKWCKETCSHKDCDRLCAKQIQSMIQLQDDVTKCGETCDKNITMNSCRSTCIAKVSGVSEADQAKMQKVIDTTKSCNKTDTELSNKCAAEALGVTKKLIDAESTCFNQNCLFGPDDQFIKCSFDCFQPIFNASSIIKDGDNTTKKDDLEATLKDSSALRHHKNSPTVVSIVSSMLFASLILNLVAFS